MSPKGAITYNRLRRPATRQELLCSENATVTIQQKGVSSDITLFFIALLVSTEPFIIVYNELYIKKNGEV